jgi:uncharacterized membrane protein
MARVRAACVLAAGMLAACGRPESRTPSTARAPEPTGEAPSSSAIFRCVGNEPGWTLDIRTDSLVFVGDYGEIHDGFPAVTPRTGDGLWYWEAEKRGESGEFARIVALVARDSCSDGMSDRVYGYRARVIYGAKAWIGCADRR